MISTASSCRETDSGTLRILSLSKDGEADSGTLRILSLSKDGGQRGSTLAAALALVFLIFAVTTILLARVASIYSESGVRRSQTSALFLAEAGIQKAAHRLTQNPTYTGEKATRLPTGAFDVSVTRSGAGYAVTSTGYADSPLRRHPKRTVRATVRILSLSKGGRSFRIADWRENR